MNGSFLKESGFRPSLFPSRPRAGSAQRGWGMVRRPRGGEGHELSVQLCNGGGGIPPQLQAGPGFAGPVYVCNQTLFASAL